MVTELPDLELAYSSTYHENRSLYQIENGADQHPVDPIHRVSHSNHIEPLSELEFFISSNFLQKDCECYNWAQTEIVCTKLTCDLKVFKESVQWIWEFSVSTLYLWRATCLFDFAIYLPLGMLLSQDGIIDRFLKKLKFWVFWHSLVDWSKHMIFLKRIVVPNGIKYQLLALLLCLFPVLAWKLRLVSIIFNIPLIHTPHNTIQCLVGIDIKVVQETLCGSHRELLDVLMKLHVIDNCHALHDIVDPGVLFLLRRIPNDGVTNAHAIFSVTLCQGVNVESPSVDWPLVFQGFLPFCMLYAKTRLAQPKVLLRSD